MRIRNLFSTVSEHTQYCQMCSLHCLWIEISGSIHSLVHTMTGMEERLKALMTQSSKPSTTPTAPSQPTTVEIKNVVSHIVDSRMQEFEKAMMNRMEKMEKNMAQMLTNMAVQPSAMPASQNNGRDASPAPSRGKPPKTTGVFSGAKR